jgi:hypothetical protein
LIEVSTDVSGYTTTTVTEYDDSGNEYVTTYNDDGESTTTITSTDKDGNTLVTYTDETGTTTYTFTTTDDEGNTISTTTDEDDNVVEVEITSTEGEEYEVLDEVTIGEESSTAIYTFDSGTITVIEEDGTET